MDSKGSVPHSMGRQMSEVWILADMSIMPFVLAGSVVLVVICGVCVSAAVLLAGFIRRKRSQQQKDRNTQ